MRSGRFAVEDLFDRVLGLVDLANLGEHGFVLDSHSFGDGLKGLG